MKAPVLPVQSLKSIARSACTFLRSCLFIGLCSGSAIAQTVPDLTNGGTLSSLTISFNLGPTGMRGMAYHVRQDTSLSRQIKVTAVEAGSPAAGILAADDVILGASGTAAAPTNFTADARKSLANAINDAEALSPATLKLIRWRAGVTETVNITLQTMGAYSATAPYNCPKSELILQQGLAAVMAGETPGLFSFSTLSLLAAYDPADPNNAARMARAEAEVLALIPNQQTLDVMLTVTGALNAGSTWERGHTLIVLSEYFLRTGDARVIPAIRSYAVLIARNQTLFGTMSHVFSDPWVDGSLNGPMGSGYGPVNNAGIPCWLGLILAKKCGLTDPEIDPAIERASRFFAYYTHKGVIPYGEHQTEATTYESNGKMGLAALAFSFQPTRATEARYFTQMAATSPREREIGHTGTFFNYLWAPLGAAAGGEAAAAFHFSEIRWMLDLNRTWNGKFVYDCLNGEGPRDGTQYGSNPGFRMSTAALLTYALPLRNLHITGKSFTPAQALTPAEIADSQAALDYKANTRTLAQLLTDIGSWSPVIRRAAANRILTFSANPATINQLTTIATDAGAFAGARIEACYILGRINDEATTAARTATLVGLLTDPENHVRFTSAEAMFKIANGYRLPHLNTILQAAVSTETPLFPISDEDPLHQAHARLCLLLFDSTDGILSGNKVSLAPKNLLYPAIKAVARNPIGFGRGSLASIYDFLTEEEMHIVSGPVIDAARDRSPADRMFSRSGRAAALEFLKKFDVAEGVPVALAMMRDDYALVGSAFDVLDQYAGGAKTVSPDPDVEGYMNELIRFDQYVTDAQELLAIIAADTNPTSLVPLKSILSVTADDATLTLPINWTTLRADGFDHAEGTSVYTWRKIHGAGNVTFAPNGTAASDNCVALFDNTPGEYLFEVTMTDQRGLTQVTGTVAVSLGPIPPNSPPVANSQSAPILRATPALITLTGSDPENYPLIYTIVDQPTHGTLEGTAPSLIYTPDYNYLGADTFTFRVMDSEGQLSAPATVSITVSENAGISASIYEPFDYPAGVLNGANGGIGFSGPWTNSGSTSTTVVAPTLTYGTLPVTGGSISTALSGAQPGGVRPISTTALAGAGLLNDGSTLWFSVLVGQGPTANVANNKIGFALANSGFWNGNSAILNEGAQLGSGLGFYVINTEGRITATQFRDPSFVLPGNPFSGNIYGTQSPIVTNINTQGEYRFVVGKITWGATEDVLELYFPDSDLNLGTVQSFIRANVNQSTFDTLTWNKIEATLLDEIRFGPTYYSVLAGNAPFVADTAAPTPAPMSFLQAPTPISTSAIRMEAVPVTDPSGVEYFFTCTAGGGSDSGWQTSPIYTPSGLTPGVTYSYTVKSRDNSPALNQTAQSAALSATISAQAFLTDFTTMYRLNAESIISTLGMNIGIVTLTPDPNLPEGTVISQSPPGNANYPLGTTVNLNVVAPDTFAPNPNPATFAVAPAAVDYYSITMTATTGTDPAGVQYLFTETSGNPGGTSSGWQDSPVYTDTGLTDGTQYTYTVTLRDKSAAINYTTASAPASATTVTLPPATIAYWDGGNGSWGNAASWSSVSGATTPDLTAAPIFVDTAYFNTSGTASQDVALNADQSIASLIFRSGTPHIVGNTSGTTPRTLTIGSGGITINNTVAANFEIGRDASNLGAVNILLGANQTWTNNDNNILTVSGVISGNAQLTKSGTGPLTLSGANTFTGGVIVNGGTLTAGDNAHSFLGSSFNALVTVNSGATLNFNRLDTTGTMTLNGGSVNTLNGFGATWRGSIILQSTALLQNAAVGGGPLIVNAVISGPGGISRTTGSAGDLRLFSANTFYGDMVWGVTNSKLELNHFLALQNSTLDTTNTGLGGQGSVENGIRTNQTTLTLGGLSGNKDLKSLFATNATAGGYNNLTALTLNPGVGKSPAYSGGIVNGASGMTLTKTGPGTQALSGTHTYSGFTTVAEGTLALAGASLTSRIVVEGGASLNFTPGFTNTTNKLVEFTSGSTVSISGTPILDSYTLMTATNGFIVNGTIGPVPPVPGYDLIVDGTALKLVANNAAPVWASNPLAIANASEDSAYTATLAGLATDSAGEPLTFVKISGPAWLTIAPDGALSGTPVQSDVGVNVFTVSASDGIRAPVQTTLNITVLATNDAPVWTVNPLTRSNAITDSPYGIYAQTLAISVTDEDGNPLTYAKVSGPVWLVVEANGSLTGTPLLADAGANVFTVSVSDGIAPPVTATLNIIVLTPSTIYWDGVSSSWDNTTNWTTNPAATTPNPLAVPGFADTAIFNRTGAIINQTITLDANQSVAGLTFNNTGTSTFRGNSAGTTNRTLTIGGGGITFGASANTVEIGNTPATYGAVNVILAANQIWNNTNQLTVTGSISGNAQLTKNGAGNLRLNGTNVFTGAVVINNGLVSTVGANHSFLGSTTNAQVTVNTGGRLGFNSTIITGTMTLNGGTADNTGSGTSSWSGTTILQTTCTLQGASSNGTLTMNSVISGPGGFTKGTGGILTLTAENSFNGDTISLVGASSLLNLNHSLALKNSTLDTTSSGLGVAAAGLQTNATTLTLGGLSGNKDLKSLFRANASAGGYNNLTALTLNPGTGKTPLYTGGIVNGAANMTLTKTGAGTQTLSGINTYTGPTTVSEGTLALVGGSQASAITVASGASLGFTLGSTTTSSSSVNVTAGTIAITGTPTLASYTLMTATGGFTGTPVLSTPLVGYALVVDGTSLKLNYTASAAYQAWATAQGLTGNNALPASDPDSDTNINLLEFAFGTNPNAGGGGALAYVAGGALSNPGPPVARNLAVGGGVNYRAIFARRKDHVAAGLTYTVQFSADMSNWVNSAATPTILTGDNTQNPGDIEAVSVPYPLFVPVTGGYKKPTFFRVTVSMP